MIRMIRYDKNGFVKDITKVYGDGESPVGIGIADIFYLVVVLGFLGYVFRLVQ